MDLRKATLTIIAVPLIFFAGCIEAQQEGQEMDISQLVPDEVPGWTIDGEDAIYDKETIFHYMNGAGEVYLSFHYQEMFVRHLKKEGEEGIVIELYDMGNSHDAFGIFARSREGEEAGIGQGSEFRSGYLIFWKGKYFATVYTLEESEASNEAVLHISGKIADNIGDIGELPGLLEFLPVENRDDDTIRFFHKYTDLNQHYFVSDENILNLSLDTDAVLANYNVGEHYPFLLIVDYGSEDSAQAAYNSFLRMFMPEAKDTGIIQLEDNLWSAAKIHGNYVVAVFDADSETLATDLINKVTSKINGGNK